MIWVFIFVMTVACAFIGPLLQKSVYDDHLKAIETYKKEIKKCEELQAHREQEGCSRDPQIDHYIQFWHQQIVEENAKFAHNTRNWPTSNSHPERESGTQQSITPACPNCGSHNTRRISDLSRATSVAMLGVASSKIGKQYECRVCYHKW